MTHETAREKLLDLAYGELAGREARRIEAHLHTCEACRAELAAIRDTRGLMSALGEEPAPERGEAELLAAARAAAEGRRRPRVVALPPWLWGVSVGAAALLAVGAVSYRLLALAPARREDPEALLGRGPLERGPGAADHGPAMAAKPGVVAPERGQEVAPEGHLGGAVERRTEAPARQKKARAPEPAAAAPAPQTGATPPRRERASIPSAEAPEPRPLSAPSIGIAEAPVAGRAAEAPAPATRSPAPVPRAPDADSAASPGSTRSDAPRAALAAPAQGAPVEDDAVGRWQALRAAGRLRGEVVTFLDCPGEAWRKVELDPQGRVVRYVRHGLAGGVPFEAELFYAEGGALGAVRYREAHGAWRELRFPGARAGPAGAIPAPALDPTHASEAAAGAPPRCRF